MEIYVLFNDENGAETWGKTRAIALKKYIDTFEDYELSELDFLEGMHLEQMTKKEFNALPEG